jgi:methionyl aminopeptidase
LIVPKTPAQLDQMAKAGDILVRCLKMLRTNARPGVTTADLDAMAEKFILSQGATAAFKGYRGFPGSICASPNSMVVHGIPGPYELQRGDVISIDVGVVYDGWVADAAMTVGVGEISESAQSLLETTKASLFSGIAEAKVGNHLGDISHAIQKRIEQDDLAVIKSLVGHGIGRRMHEDPQIPNYGEPGRGPLLEEGMTFAIEPMVNIGSDGILMGDDGWSVYSDDGSLAAHFEFTIAVGKDGPRILTPWHED